MLSDFDIGLDFSTRNILDLNVKELLTEKAIDNMRGRKALKAVKQYNRSQDWYHYKKGGFFTYARFNLSQKPLEFKERFLKWKETPDKELTNIMACELVEAMLNRFTYDVVSTTPRSVERCGYDTYHPSQALAEQIAKELNKPYRTLFKIRTSHRDKGHWQRSQEKSVLLKPIRNKFILLIDDVVMSGNTLFECGKLLRRYENDVESLAYMIYG